MAIGKILSTRLLETFIIAGVVLGGIVLVIGADIDHIKENVQDQKKD